MTHQLSASILSADALNLMSDVQAMIDAGVDRLHVDVMDNHYVPNLTFGPQLAAKLKARVHCPVDVHLMAMPSDALIERTLEAGADLIYIHPSTTQRLDDWIERIHSAGVSVGLVINPDEEAHLISPWLEAIDAALIMGVSPGFGGQAFQPKVLDTIQTIRQQNSTLTIEVDGGVNLSLIPTLKAHGVSRFVSGSELFKSNDYQTVVKEWKTALLVGN